jgi:hypothetical protein
MLTRHWQVFIVVNNLFDAAYEAFIGPQREPAR